MSIPPFVLSRHDWTLLLCLTLVYLHASRFVLQMGFLDVILGFLKQLQDCEGNSLLGF